MDKIDRDFLRMFVLACRQDAMSEGDSMAMVRDEYKRQESLKTREVINGKADSD